LEDATPRDAKLMLFVNAVCCAIVNLCVAGGLWSCEFHVKHCTPSHFEGRRKVLKLVDAQDPAHNSESTMLVNHGQNIPYYDATMLQCCDAAMLRCCHAAMLRRMEWCDACHTQDELGIDEAGLGAFMSASFAFGSYVRTSVRSCAFVRALVRAL
jgi:hypothetical protein